MEDKRIAVAVDGSETAIRALHTGVRLAEATGRKLVLVHVHPVKMPVATEMGAFDEGKATEAGQASARAIFDEARAVLGSKVRDPETVLLWGDPAEELISYQEQNPGTHLVMGRRGFSKIQALLLGSVSEKVLRHAKGLVTVVS